MQICWDSLENIYLTKKGNFRLRNGATLKYFENCKQCDESYLAF
jgi:hypothetical protein